MPNKLFGIYQCRTIGLGNTYGGLQSHFFDGSLEDTHNSVFPSVGTSHSHLGIFEHPHPGKHTAKVNVSFTNNSVGCDIWVGIREVTTAITFAFKAIQHFGTSPISVEVSYQGGGIPNGEPTYLEELSKLDQFTKAQYIPDRRQRLDI